MQTLEKTIDIDVPVRAAYDQWTQFESFPRFMEGVEKVTQVDDRHLHWIAKVGGRRQEWDAEIIEQVPDRRIEWRTERGDINSGIVTFQPLDDRHSRVGLRLAYEPEGITESVGDKLGFMSRRTEGDLKRFKTFIEKRGGEPTGGWRGTVA
jgi:uncharacterized membrane protein